MNGKIQGIIVCGVVIACLGGTLVFLQHSGKDDASNSQADSSSSAAVSTESKAESVLLIDSSADKISKITAVNEFGSYTMVKPDSGKATWNIEELTGINQSSTMKSGMADDVAQLEAYKLVEANAEDLSKYGLETPTGQFTVTFTDGSERTFKIGDVSTKNRYRYFCEDGNSDVYMMLNSRISYFTESVNSFVDTTLIANPGDDNMPDYGKLTIKRTDIDYEMSFEQDDESESSVVSAQVMTEPIFAYLNITGSSATTHGMYGLAAESVEVVKPTEEDFKKYGLDEPFAEVTFKGDGYDYDLKIGDSINATTSDGEETTEIGSYYCYLSGVEGEDCIWVVSASNLPWATVQPGDVISLMTTNSIWNVDELKVEANGEVSDYILENGDDQETNSVKKNGTDVDVDCFKGLYQFLISCPTDDIYFTEPTGEKYMTIEIICSDGHTDKMEFYKETSRKSVIVLNDRPSYIVPTKWAERFISNMQNVDEGKETVDTY